MNIIINDSIKDLDGEIWQPIQGYNYKYLISNYARVKSFKHHKAILLKQQKNQKGYMRVSLWKDGMRKTYSVSRLVAIAFVPNDDPLNKNTVDHIDGNKNHNTPNNLQWLSLSDNVKAYYSKKKK